MHSWEKFPWSRCIVFIHRDYSQQYCNNYVWCPVGTGNLGGNTLQNICFFNHYAVYLNVIQNNIEHKLIEKSCIF